jgi:hypothetical protein
MTHTMGARRTSRRQGTGSTESSRCRRLQSPAIELQVQSSRPPTTHVADWFSPEDGFYDETPDTGDQSRRWTGGE